MSNTDSLRRSSRKRKPSSKVKSERDGSPATSEVSLLSVASHSPQIPSPLQTRQSSVSKTSPAQRKTKIATPKTRPEAPKQPPTPDQSDSTKPIKLTLKRLRSPSGSNLSPKASDTYGKTLPVERRVSKRRKVTPIPFSPPFTNGSARKSKLPMELERAFGNIEDVFDSEIPPLDLASVAQTPEVPSIGATPLKQLPILGPPVASPTPVPSPSKPKTPEWDSSILDRPLPYDHLTLRPTNAQRAFFSKKPGYKGFYRIEHFSFYWQPDPELPRFLGGETVDLGPNAKVPSPGKRKREREVKETQADEEYVPAGGKKKLDKRFTRRLRKSVGQVGTNEDATGSRSSPTLPDKGT